MKIFISRLLLLGIFNFICSFDGIYAQLGLCSGNSGAPIQTVDFGAGTMRNALPDGVTTYRYSPAGAPGDGAYIVSSNSNFFDWFDIDDHTPGDVNGKMLIINADSNTSGEFFNLFVDNLCEGTTYELSAWLLNLVPIPRSTPPIPINVRFEIINPATGLPLARGDTGEIASTTTPIWNQRGLVFTTPPGQTSVILRLSNNGVGGNGNDLALDDIVFRTCGDALDLTDSTGNTEITLCQSELPATPIILDPNPDGAIFTTYFYQWQVSADNTAWADLPGENNPTLELPPTLGTRYYRVLIAESAVNLSNALCNIISDVYQANFNPNPVPPINDGDVVACAGGLAIPSVTAPDDIEVNWYDAPNGGTLLLSDSTTLSVMVADTYYAEAIDPETNCVSVTRTPVNVTFTPVPDIEDEDVTVCEGGEVEISAGFTGPGVRYFWDTGEISESITVNVARVYIVDIVNDSGCLVRKEVTVTEIPAPAPPVSNGDVFLCDNEAFTTVSVTAPIDLQINWYDAPTDGNLLRLDSENLDTTIVGTFYAEAIDRVTECKSLTRTPVVVAAAGPPILEDEEVDFCDGESTIISANFTGDAIYLWNTGETTADITVDQPGTYTVAVTRTIQGCTNTKTITVTALENGPFEVRDIRSEHRDIVVSIAEANTFEFSLDGITYQNSNRFENLRGGPYTIFVLRKNGCGEPIQVDYQHMVIPRFFTPNGDNANDTFAPEGFIGVQNYRIDIFDRFGKPLASSRDLDFTWDGTFNGRPVSSSDYWYSILIDDKLFKGHVALKR